ncbi:MAG: radical SAM protein [bacterium]|nr:MAG: radical SAM protein [bacterium]
MRLTRRDFIKHACYLGSLAILPLSARRGWGDREPWRPSYRTLEAEGKFAGRIDRAYAIFEECELCPRRCGVNRSKGERGFCRAPLRPVVFSAHPHFGEETPLVGHNGSGTIFFSNCNLRCVFCQNWPISHRGEGREMDDAQVARIMLKLQRRGCHNINLVTPTHVMPNILNAARIAMKEGLRIPLVYNTSGYERLTILHLLDGVVDIYLPDMKYMDPEQAATYSPGASDYPEVAMDALVEMNRQVGVLKTDEEGIARRGLIVRHLVMPNRVAGTEKLVQWIARELPRSTYVNIMPQYRVEYRAYEYPRIARGITREEFLEAISWAEEAGLTNLDDRSLMMRDFLRRR